MSFTINTGRNEWKVSMGQIIGAPKEKSSIWVAFNQNYEHVEADSLDHLMIAIDQFEDLEEEMI